VAYFKAVVRKPELSPRNYVIAGEFGCGKSSLVRAFAADLIGTTDILSSNNYMELDASSLQTKRQVEGIMNYIFGEVEGWKVVLWDESHLLSPEIQQQLLKPLEDFVGNIFFFFATTEGDKMLDTLYSRCIDFTLRSFTTDEQKAYLATILEREGLTASPKFYNLAAFHAGGHLRDLLNQVDLLKIMGEEEYLRSRGLLPRAIRDYFGSKDTSGTEVFSRFPIAMVRSGIDRFFRENVVQNKLFFRPGEIPKVFMNYLKFKSYTKTDDDFYSMLFLWKESFVPSQAQVG
jgi:DNA polymerase III delta prime subunit